MIADHGDIGMTAAVCPFVDKGSFARVHLCRPRRGAVRRTVEAPPNVGAFAVFDSQPCIEQLQQTVDLVTTVVIVAEEA
jgi:hypothetical protein